MSRLDEQHMQAWLERDTMRSRDTVKARAEAIHASDCAYWCAEPCDCAMRHDPDELLDRTMDELMEGKQTGTSTDWSKE